MKDGEGGFLLWVELLCTVWSPFTGCDPRVSSMEAVTKGREG